MPRPGSDDGRWKSKFARFIKSYGVESLAVQLDVEASAIYHWVRGVSAPRRTHAEIIKRLARERGCRLTMDAIYAHAHAVRADEIEPATAMPSSLTAGARIRRSEIGEGLEGSGSVSNNATYLRALK